MTAADAGDSDEHLADALAASMPRRCATAEAGSPLMHASSLDDPDKDEYQIMDCDAPVQAIFFVCVMEKLPAETSCGRDVLEHLQNGLVDEDSAAATWTLAMMDATDEFNSRAASDPTFRFSVDFVTVNWHIAWYLHELTQFDRPLRALEIGASRRRAGIGRFRSPKFLPEFRRGSHRAALVAMQKSRRRRAGRDAAAPRKVVAGSRAGARGSGGGSCPRGQN